MVAYLFLAVDNNVAQSTERVGVRGRDIYNIVIAVNDKGLAIC
jgi:hypothetical protein